MLTKILIMFGLTVLQNMSFTLVSRARNSNSILFHGIAAALSNTLWLLVIQHVVTNFDHWQLMVTYVVGTVTGSVFMHHISMNYIEKHKWFKGKKNAKD